MTQPLRPDRRRSHALAHPGVLAALLAAALFGAGTPLAKHLLGQTEPWLLAGLLYLGSGLGLALWRLLSRAEPVRLPPGQWRWLAGAVLAGGVLGPLLLMTGLSRMPASGASLLLNAEAVFTALLAWFAFKENVDRRIALGMAAIVAGALVLSWPGQADLGQVGPALAVLGACLAWGLDNNLTRQVALADAGWVAMVKGLVAGSVNLALAWTLGGTSAWPPPPVLAAALLLGLAAYGLSLTLFVLALRHLGTARTGAYFSVAPFFGALLSLWWLGEPVTASLALAGALMALGVWLHLSEQHEHLHHHEPLVHEHEHAHDEHHQHGHEGVAISGRHRHAHRHAALSHAHAHYPDEHHRHAHG